MRAARLRRLADQVPAIIYGADKDPVSITLAHKDIMKAVENAAFYIPCGTDIGVV